MASKQAKAIIDKKVDELRDLIYADLKEVFLWHSGTLGELRSVLAETSENYLSDFTEEWNALDPDRTWYDYASERASEYDYLADDYLEPPDGWWEPTGRYKLLLGQEKLPAGVFVRYQWASSILDLLLRVLTVHAQASTYKGHRGRSEPPPIATSPRFELIAGDGTSGASIAKIMRTRWNAAEDLQLRGFHREACVFYGSLFEAVLVAYLEQTAPDDMRRKYGQGKGGEAIPIRRWSKDALFKAAEATSGLHSIVANLRPSITNFRDLIHIHSDEGIKGLHWQANEPTARILRESLFLLFKQFEESLKIPRSRP